MNVQKDLVLHLYALNDFSKFYNFSMPEHSKLATIGIRNTIANLSACRRALVPFGDNKYSQLVTRPTRCLRPRALSTLDALLGCIDDTVGELTLLTTRSWQTTAQFILDIDVATESLDFLLHEHGWHDFNNASVLAIGDDTYFQGWSCDGPVFTHDISQATLVFSDYERRYLRYIWSKCRRKEECTFMTLSSKGLDDEFLRTTDEGHLATPGVIISTWVTPQPRVSIKGKVYSVSRLANL